MHVQVFGIGGGEQFLDGLFERPTIHQLESQHHADAIEGAHRQHAFAQQLGLCVPKTSNPTIVVMKSAQDGA
jgi:hypothetical protein